MATKKTATKKVTKKRATKREPKTTRIEKNDNPVNTAADEGEVLDKAHDDMMDAIGGVQRYLGGYAEAQSPISILRQIQVIDLRGASVKDRFQLLLLLTSEGYITTTVESLIDDLDNLRTALEADTLVLLHENKLVRPASWEEIESSDYRAISRPAVNNSKINIGFSLPEPAYPDTTRIGNAQYVRVG